MELLPCPFCSGIAELQRDNTVFSGQNYSDRYTEEMANQDYGFQVRCAKCGLQTCWWHYGKEAVEAWNTRTPPNVEQIVSGIIDHIKECVTHETQVNTKAILRELHKLRTLSKEPVKCPDCGCDMDTVNVCTNCETMLGPFKQ